MNRSSTRLFAGALSLHASAARPRIVLLLTIAFLRSSALAEPPPSGVGAPLNGGIRWLRPLRSEYHKNGLAVSTHRVLVSTFDGLESIDPQTGVTFKANWTARPDWLKTSGDKVLFEGANGCQVAHEALEEPKKLLSLPIPGQEKTHWWLNEGRYAHLYDGRSLSYVDLSKGVVRTLRVPSLGESPPFTAGDELAFAFAAHPDEDKGDLHCIDLSKNKIIWSRTLKGQWTTLAQSRGRVYVLAGLDAAQAQSLHLLTLAAARGDGDQRVDVETVDHPYLLPSDDALLLIGSARRDGRTQTKVTAVNNEGAAVLWRQEVGCTVIGQAVVAKGVLYLPCSDSVVAYGVSDGRALGSLDLWNTSDGASLAVLDDSLLLLHGRVLYALQSSPSSFAPTLDPVAPEAMEVLERALEAPSTNHLALAALARSPSSLVAWRLMAMSNDGDYHFRPPLTQRFAVALTQPPAPTRGPPNPGDRLVVARSGLALLSEPQTAPSHRLPSGLEVTVLGVDGDLASVKVRVPALPEKALALTWTTLGAEGPTESGDSSLDAVAAVDFASEETGFVKWAGLESAVGTPEELAQAAEQALTKSKTWEAVDLLHKAATARGDVVYFRKLLRVLVEAGDLTRAAEVGRELVRARHQAPERDHDPIAIDVRLSVFPGCKVEPTSKISRGESVETWEPECFSRESFRPPCIPCAEIKTADTQTKWMIAERRRAAKSYATELESYLEKNPYSPWLKVSLRNKLSTPLPLGTLALYAPGRVVEACNPGPPEPAAVAKIAMPFLEPGVVYSFWVSLREYEATLGLGPYGNTNCKSGSSALDPVGTPVACGAPTGLDAVDRGGYQLFRAPSAAEFRKVVSTRSALATIRLQTKACTP